MFSELKPSKKLKKKQKKDFCFRSLLFPESRNYVQIEHDIWQAKTLYEDESIFSKNTMNNDTDFENETLKGMMRYGVHEDENIEARRNFIIEKILLQKEQKKQEKTKQKIQFVSPLTLKKINPVQKMRIVDICFPFDCDIFKDLSGKNTKNFECFFNIYEYKRASSVTYDKNKEVFTVKYHEKNFDENFCDKNMKIYNYYLEWLDSLANAKAVNLLQRLKSFKEAIENEVFLLTSQPTYTYKKILKEIDQETMNFILNQPYFSKLEHIELVATSENTGLIEEEYSMAFLKIKGYSLQDIETITSKLLRMDIQQEYIIRDFYNAAINMLARKKTESCQHTALDGIAPKRTITKNRNMQIETDGRQIIKAEKWLENNKQYKKSYYIPTDINHKQLI